MKEKLRSIADIGTEKERSSRQVHITFQEKKKALMQENWNVTSPLEESPDPLKDLRSPLKASFKATLASSNFILKELSFKKIKNWPNMFNTVLSYYFFVFFNH